MAAYYSYTKPYYVYGADTAEAMTFVSLMRASGYTNFVVVPGGFSAIRANERFYIVSADS